MCAADRVERAPAPSGAQSLLFPSSDREPVADGGCVRILAILTLLVSAADHWTTYLCLRTPVAGWRVTEANPIADWLFESYGLVEGLMIDSAITLLAVAYLLTTRKVPRLAKGMFFAVVIAWTGFAVLNNLQAIQALGLSPLGAA